MVKIKERYLGRASPIAEYISVLNSGYMLSSDFNVTLNRCVSGVVKEKLTKGLTRLRQSLTQLKFAAYSSMLEALKIT